MAKVILDIRQKRAKTAMKQISVASSINQTQNAMYHQQVAEERIAHKKDRDDHYNAKVQMQVMQTLKDEEDKRSKDERRLVSIDLEKFLS